MPKYDPLWKKIEDTKALALPEKFTSCSIPPFVHCLPPELRNKIYEMVIHRKTYRVAIAGAAEHPLAAASRRFPRLRSEINSYVFSDCQFSVDVYSRFEIYNASYDMAWERQRSGRFGVGRLVLEPGHWMFDRSAGVRFRSIAVNVKEKGGFLLANIFFNARPTQGCVGKSIRASMRVRYHGLVCRRKSFLIMADKARDYVEALRLHPNFAGFTLTQLREIARFFEWTSADRSLDDYRNYLDSKKGKKAKKSAAKAT